MIPKLILINPWIYDFAAYDLWSKPLGLLYLAGYLRHCGFQVHLVDCLDNYHPGMNGETSFSQPTRRRFGTGKFWRREIPKPRPLSHIPRAYGRYGISAKAYRATLADIPNPDAILVTSLMTYWYPGVNEVIALAKEVHPKAPVILGGIYAGLCRDHALEFSGADEVYSQTGLDALAPFLHSLEHHGLSLPKNPPPSGELPYPAFDMLRKLDYACLLTSRGCPYRCQYCASRFLNPRFHQRDPHDVIGEILHWHEKYGIRDFAFYDDALLVGADDHLGIILEKISDSKLDLRFHTPNALHVREIRPETARLLYRSGFRTIRLGLETTDMALHHDLDGKVSEGDFERAVKNLHDAGFPKQEIGVYILMGLPEQTPENLLKTLDSVGRQGVMPFLAEYSPIPNTPLWNRAVRHSEYDLESEPLFHNNTLVPCWNKGQRDCIPKLKRRVREIRETGR